MKTIIAGAYAIGTHLARLFSRDHEDITLIDTSAERLGQVGADTDLLTLEDSPTSIHALKQAGVSHADLFIAVNPNESDNITACMLAKSLGARKTVAKVDNPEFTEAKAQELFQRLGIDSVIDPDMLAAYDINNGLKMSWVRQRWDVHDGELVMLGIKLRESCEILNKPLKEISGPEDPYHVVAIKRGGQTIIPGGNDELLLYDLAYFMTTRSYIPYIRQIVGKDHYVDVKNVMVMGGGSITVRAVKRMPEYMDCKIIEIDGRRCEELNELIDDGEAMIIHGDGRDTSLLIEEGIKNTQAFVALTDSPETNILACLAAKRLGVRKTVALVENMDYVSMAESLDIGTIVNRKTVAAGHIYQMMLDANVLNIHFLMNVNAYVAEFIPLPGSRVTQKAVKDLGLPRDVTIGGLVRQGKGMLVSGNTQIEAGDSVMVFCHEIDMHRIEKYFT